MGARRETLMGLAGMGDLILTCTGDLSRNRRVGLALAVGRPLAAIVQELGHVAEGSSPRGKWPKGQRTWASTCPLSGRFVRFWMANFLRRKQSISS